MTQSAYEHVKRVFHGAVELHPAQRATYVTRECGDDPSLRTEVEQLLLQHDIAEGYLEAPLRTPPPDSEAPGPAGPAQHGAPRFASYTVLRTLGRGGMGVVYLAQQDATRRTVALKVIRPGLATDGALKRFTFEAQVLGRLNHPGIAQIYEAGTADAGDGPQPYFAMELVDGVPLTTHARARSLDAPARLALLAEVCDAVEYAHVKGVIHRDLKPANILVDASGHVKVLDFGVARATTPAPDSGDTQPSDAGRLPSLNTERGQLLGTLPYMSPEQVAGDPDDLDTRSDVYSLGVIGYELLADKPAFEVDRLHPLEAARLVKETDPAPLSSFNRVYRGDIETVIARAMDKDRDRRYQSAAALAADIRRSLSDQPIEARPASAWYQVRKFARRNQPIAVATMLVAATVVAGLIAVGVLARREARARRAAESLAWSEAEARTRAETAADTALRERAIASSIREFLENMLVSASPKRFGRDAKVADVLEDAARRIDHGEIKDPLVVASLRTHIGYGLGQLARLEPAEATLRLAREGYRELEGPDSHHFLATSRELAMVLLDAGKVTEAEQILREVLDAWERAEGPDADSALRSRGELATCLTEAGKPEAAEPILRQCVEEMRSRNGPLDPTVLAMQGNYAALLLELDRLEEGAALAREVVENERALYGTGSPEPGHALSTYCFALTRLKQYQEAEQIAREAEQHCLEAFGTSHHQTIIARVNLAGIFCETGRLVEAEGLLRQQMAIVRDDLGPGHPLLRNCADTLSSVLRKLDRADEAEELLRQVIDHLDSSADGRYPAALLRGELCKTLLVQRKRAEAETEALKSYAEIEKLFGATDPRSLENQRVIEKYFRAYGGDEALNDFRNRAGLTPPAITSHP